MIIAVREGYPFVYPYNINCAKCYTEYRFGYDNIKFHPLQNTDIAKKDDELLLIPFTHITNIWHLMHQLFIIFKHISVKKIKTQNVYFMFFDNFYKRQGNILECKYNDLIFKGMGFNYEHFKELHQIFLNNNAIEVNNLHIVNQGLNLSSEPLFNNFRNHIIDNFGIKYHRQNITFILRKGTREITNIDFVKENLKEYKINYIFMEEHSIEDQVDIAFNSKIIIGVHGAGLTWSVFMNPGSLLIEMYPGNSDTDNYIRWCRLAKIKYKRLPINITKGKEQSFRDATVNMDINHINVIKNLISK